MKSMFPVKFAVVGIVLTLSSSVWAWGHGHDTIGRSILRKLPSEWQVRLKPEWKQKYIWATHLPAGFVPLVELRAPDQTFLTGVDNRSCAYIPFNAIFAYALTNERPCLDPFFLQLDSAGETVLFGAFDCLLPK